MYHHCEPTGRANARPMTDSAKQSIERQESLDCFVASLLAMTSNALPRSRGAMRPSCAGTIRPEKQRAWGMPGARCTRSLACSVKNTRVSHHRSTGTPGIPARNGFNGFLRALPGDRALLSPSSSGYGFVCARSGRQASAGLDAGVEASGPHDFAVRSNISRQHAIDRSQATARPAITSRAQRCRVHRIPPRVRDDRDTPL